MKNLMISSGIMINMYEVNCKTCGRELFIGKVLENSYEYWCPFCSGLNLLEINEAINVCENYITETRENALAVARTFSKSALLFAALNSREMESRNISKMENNHVQAILWSSLIIRDCIKGNYNNRSSKQFTAQNLSELFRYYACIIQSENLLVKVKEGHFSLFEVNSTTTFDYFRETIETEGKTYLAFPAQQWRYYLEMMKTVQMCPDERFDQTKNYVNVKVKEYLKKKKGIILKIQRAGKKAKKRLETELSNIEKSSRAEIYEITYNSFHSVYYNKDFFSFEEIGKNAKIIDFIDLIIEDSVCEIKSLSERLGEEQFLYEIEIRKFKTLCDSKGLDFTEVRRILISSEDDCKEFPLLVEYENKILVCPKTLLFIVSLIKFDTDREGYKSSSYLLGDDFENEVKAIFESNGFSLRHPVHKDQELVRKKIKFEKEGESREIDLIPYNDKLLFVVECKRNSFKPGYIFKYERQERISKNDGIIDEIDNKHIDRVAYFQEKQNEFGFKNHRKVKGLIVTLIKEDIESYKDIDILPLCDLEMYLKQSS
ncbi:hypothetical protein MSVAZ_2078 [Methanosarcina vacuolata Z-761]|uniref:NERD domain-containing protein n=2 Tax=Methanosarcina vacuolata TaxID=2215 RepID=A0A0E3Q6J6_9EURY|nr:hypothetical protein MSVAZ_2078 [Methanosarcina vacuolata Z-761]